MVVWLTILILVHCNPNAVGQIHGYNLYWYVPNGANGNFSLGNQGVPYLMCGNWQTNYYQSDVSGSINNNMISYTGSNGNFAYLAAHMLVFANLAGNAWTTVLLPIILRALNLVQ